MLTIYHNPRCSKSRETLTLLQQQSEPFQVVEYLSSPPDADTLQSILQKLGISARELLRTKEDEYKLLDLQNPALTDEQLIAAMVAHPKLIERPIVVKGYSAAIGRPASNILALL